MNKKNINIKSSRFHKKPLLLSGGLTVETACVIPLFIFAVLSLYSFIDMIRFQQRLNSAMYETVREMAVYAQVLEEDNREFITGSVGKSIAISYLYGKNKITERIGSEELRRAPLVNGSQGLNFLQSSVMEENDMIDFVVSYRMAPQVPFFDFYSMPFFSRCRMHAWTGYEVSEHKQLGLDKQIVFICENATVYHINRECTHLRLTINGVSYEAALTAVNENRERYRPCEICCRGEPQTNVYIARQGNRYHNNLGCSGLKRTIFEIELNQVRDLPLCMRCAQTYPGS